MVLTKVSGEKDVSSITQTQLDRSTNDYSIQVEDELFNGASGTKDDTKNGVQEKAEDALVSKNETRKRNPVPSFIFHPNFINIPTISFIAFKRRLRETTLNDSRHYADVLPENEHKTRRLNKEDCVSHIYLDKTFSRENTKSTSLQHTAITNIDKSEHTEEQHLSIKSKSSINSQSKKVIPNVSRRKSSKINQQSHSQKQKEQRNNSNNIEGFSQSEQFSKFTSLDKNTMIKINESSLESTEAADSNENTARNRSGSESQTKKIASSRNTKRRIHRNRNKGTLFL